MNQLDFAATDCFLRLRSVQPWSSPVGSAVTWLSNFEGGNVTRKGRGFSDVAFTYSRTKRKRLSVAKRQTLFYNVYKKLMRPLLKHVPPEDMWSALNSWRNKSYEQISIKYPRDVDHGTRKSWVNLNYVLNYNTNPECFQNSLQDADFWFKQVLTVATTFFVGRSTAKLQYIPRPQRGGIPNWQNVFSGL